MKFSYALLSVLLTFSFLTVSCDDVFFGISGSGQVISENRIVANFDNIEMDIAGNVEITKDSIISVEISDYENLLPHISTFVSGHTLVLRYEPRNLNVRHSAAGIKISVPSMSDITVNGSGRILLSSGFDHLKTITISGSGEVNVPETFDTPDLAILISGSGKATLNGNTDHLNINVSGSGNIHCYNLVAKDATCLISGSGNAFLYVVQNLHATISGSGNLTYMGNPAVTVSISGSGHIYSR